MKITYIVTRDAPIGGAQIHVRDLAEYALKRGHEVVVLAGGQSDEGRLFRQLQERGLRYVRIANLVQPLRPGADLRAVWELRAALKRENPDLVSTHSSKAGILGRLAAASLGIPAVFTAHGWAFADGVPQRSAWLYRLAERTIAPMTRALVTVSEADRELAVRFRVGRKRINTIHNGMPDVAQRARPADRSGPVRLLMIGRFQPQKDHRTLLRALSRVKSSEWELTLVGEGPLKGDVKRLAEELGIDEQVQFIGERDDVAHQLAEAHVFLLTSNWEGFPRSIIEALRAGLPVICSDVGGCSEAVVEGENGFLIPRGDEETLRGKLEALVGDPERRKQMGSTGRKMYERSFTFEQMAYRTFHLYEQILTRPRSLTKEAG